MKMQYFVSNNVFAMQKMNYSKLENSTMINFIVFKLFIYKKSTK